MTKISEEQVTVDNIGCMIHEIKVAVELFDSNNNSLIDAFEPAVPSES